MAPTLVTSGQYLPRVFLGESLYSWCSRFHRINPVCSARETSRILFSNPVAGLRHDFPTNLDYFASTTNSALGDINEVILDKTVLGIFSPFLDKKVSESIIVNMKSGGFSKIKYLLGVLPSRLGTAAPLKACPTCIQEDLSSSCTSWWHAIHQWPTTRICPTHGNYLLTASKHTHSRILQDWLLPKDVNWCKDKAPPDIAIQALARLNEWSSLVFKRNRNPYDIELLRLTYHIQCKKLGLTAMDGTLKLNQIRTSFIERYLCLKTISGFEFLKEVARDDAGFLGSILHRAEGTRHPLKHIMLMDFLFESTLHFSSEYDRILNTSIWIDSQELWSELTESREQLKLLVSNLDYSVNAAAIQLNLPVGQALRFLRQEGIPYQTRPRVLNSKREKKLRKLLSRGIDYSEIATILNIRKSFIRDYTARHSELRALWREANLVRRLNKYRKNFLQLKKKHPGYSLKKLKEIPGNGIQWLCRHDNKWLSDSLSN